MSRDIPKKNQKVNTKDTCNNIHDANFTVPDMHFDNTCFISDVRGKKFKNSKPNYKYSKVVTKNTNYIPFYRQIQGPTH